MSEGQTGLVEEMSRAVTVVTLERKEPCPMGPEHPGQEWRCFYKPNGKPLEDFKYGRDLYSLICT